MIIFQLRRLFSYFRRDKLDAEMAEEFAHHIELQSAEYRRNGMSEEDARTAAQRSFGGVEQIKERARDERSWLWLEQLLQDLRFAARTLLRKPGFALVAVITLALGVGANTAMFSLLNGLLLKPLPYDDAGQLVYIWESRTEVRDNLVSPGTYFDWRDEATSFEAVSAYRPIDLNITGNGDPERISGWRMTADGLRVLRAHSIVGRTFVPDEDLAGNNKVVVLTEELFRRRFGGDREIVGKSVLLNGEPYTVIGVLPAAFLPDPQVEFVVPEAVDPARRTMRNAQYLWVIGRLKSGVSVAAAQAEILKIRESNASLYPRYKENWTVSVVPIRDQLTRTIKPMLGVLAAAVVVVLLIACANVANLLLAKASGREREIALRIALGANRSRVMRQLLTESILLGLLGGVAGLGFAYGLLDLVRASDALARVGRSSEITIDGQVMAATLVLSFVTGLVFGLVPALQTTRLSHADALKYAGPGGAIGRGAGLRRVLIVAEVAMAMLLLAGAGLLLHSFYNLSRVSPGFDAEPVLTMAVSLPNAKYPNAGARARFYQQIVENLEAIPGVQRAAVCGSLPMGGSFSNWFYQIVGRKNAPEQGYIADQDNCTAGYFAALSIPLKGGRIFSDAETDVNSVVINEEFARQYFPGEDPLGRTLTVFGSPLQIIGVVGNVRNRSLESTTAPMVYRSQSAVDSSRNGYVMIRAQATLSGLGLSARQAIQAIDPAQPVANVRRLSDVISASIAQRRMTLFLLGGFTATALVLAVVGLYGVVEYTVSQRTRELGLRIALGALPQTVVRSTVVGGMKLVAIGLGLGLAGAVATTRLMSSLLFEVPPLDSVALVGGALVLAAAAVAACCLPARAAAHMDPMVALRTE
ncbi:MAG TPA: ABC transporter permease [Opitutaceae bacterium]|nr:ABC transporter permease [Opitutaceae bacterium]